MATSYIFLTIPSCTCHNFMQLLNGYTLLPALGYWANDVSCTPQLSIPFLDMHLCSVPILQKSSTSIAQQNPSSFPVLLLEPSFPNKQTTVHIQWSLNIQSCFLATISDIKQSWTWISNSVQFQKMRLLLEVSSWCGAQTQYCNKHPAHVRCPSCSKILRLRGHLCASMWSLICGYQRTAIP